MSIQRRLKKCMYCKKSDSENIAICNEEPNTPHYVCGECLEKKKNEARAEIKHYGIKCEHGCDKEIITIEDLYEGFTGVVTKEEGKIKTHEVEYKDGCIVYEKKWNEDGILKSHKIYDEGQKILKEEDSKKETNLSLKHLSIDYYPNGREKSRVKRNSNNPWNCEYIGLYEEWHENGERKLVINYNDNGRMDGLYEEWLKDGTKIKEHRYKDGWNDGINIDYHENGNKKKQINYEDRKESGESKYWYANGKIERIVRTEKVEKEIEKVEKVEKKVKKIPRKKVVKKEESDDSDFESLFLEEKKEYDYISVDESYYKNGKMESRVIYKNRKKDGLCEEWTNKGIKILSVMWKDGMKNGFYNEWYESGQRKKEYHYKDDRYHGECKSWYEKKGYKKGDGDGQLYEDYHAVNGYIVGKNIKYFENGVFEYNTYDEEREDGKRYYIREERYKNNRLKERSVYIYEGDDGKKRIIEKMEYLDNEKNSIINMEDYDKKRKVKYDKYNGEKKEYEYDGKDWIEIHFDSYENGQLKEDEKYDEETGLTEYIKYYSNGKVKSSVIKDKKGKKQGWDRDYYRTGLLKKENYYQDDKINGDSKEYYLNGQIRFEGREVMGNRDGDWLVWTEDGELMITRKYKDKKEIEVIYHDAYYE